MGWSHGIERWIQRAACFILVYFGLLAAVPNRHSPALVVAGATVVAVGVRAAFMKAGRADVLLLLAASVVAHVGDLTASGAATGVGVRPTFLLTVTLVVGASALLPVRAAVAVTGGAALAHLVAGGLVVGWLDAGLESLAFIASGIGVLAYCRGLRHAARRTEEAIDEATQVHLEQWEAQARDDAEADARRLLHDELISTLSALRHRPDPVMAQEAAREALGRIDSFSDSVAPAGTTPLLFPTLGITLDVDDRRDESWSSTVPETVWAAVVDAAREAVRNVARHGRTPRAEVVVTGGEGHVEVTVRDEGAGFDPAAPQGFGLRSSVRGRMDEVGGSAEVDSAPGEGTTVTLRWQGSPTRSGTEASRWRRLRALVGDLRFLVLWFPLLHLLSQAAMMVALPGPRPAPSLALGLLVVVASVALAFRAVAAPLSTGAVVASVLLPPVAVATGLWLAGPGALRSFDAWMVGLAEVPLIVLALVGPRWSVAPSMLLMSATVAAAAVLDPTLSPVDAVGHIVQPTMYGVLFALLPVAVGRLDRDVSRAHAETLQTLGDDTRRTQRRTALAARLEGQDARVRDLLARVATDEAVSPDAAREAGRLALELRDELAAEGVLTERARAAAHQVRDRGGSLALREGLDPRAADILTAVLERAAQEEGVRHVVAAPLHGALGVVVTCRPPLQQPPTDDGRVTTTEDRTTVTVSFPDRAPGPDPSVSRGALRSVRS